MLGATRNTVIPCYEFRLILEKEYFVTKVFQTWSRYIRACYYLKLKPRIKSVSLTRQ